MAKKEEKVTKVLHKEEFAEEINKVNIEEVKASMYEEIKKKVESEYVKDNKENKKGNQGNIKRKEILDKQMLVPIMNVTNGKLIYQSRKSGSEFQFEQYGDIEYIEIYELLTMRSSQRKFLDEPFVIVLDDEVADYLGLSNMYRKLTHATEIEGIFDLPLEKFTDVVKSAPKGLAHLIVSKAKEKIESKQLDSVQKVQVLEEVYNVQLTG